MAIIRCDECGRQVSDMAMTCPQCGRSIEALKLDGCSCSNCSRNQRLDPEDGDCYCEYGPKGYPCLQYSRYTYGD